MRNRLTVIVTKGGDRGETSLGSGTRVNKDHPVVEALGAIDELNSWVGVFAALTNADELRADLHLAQHDLFDLGAQLSVPGTPLLSQAHLERLEAAFHRLNAELASLKEFILPGGSIAASYGHVARTVCRRAERALVHLDSFLESTAYPVSDQRPDSFGVAYLNRLSDYLFVAARMQNKILGQCDTLWQQGLSLQTPK